MQDKFRKYKEAMEKSQIIHMPSMNISTFGESRYKYYFLTQIQNHHTRLREGHLIIKKPMILLPFNRDSLFEGFDMEMNEIANNMLKKHGDHLKLLGYQFQHTPRENWVEKDPIQEVILNLSQSIEENIMDSIIQGQDSTWQSSVFKLMLKIIEKSFQINISELEERGMFDSRGIPPQVYKDIENRFHTAKGNSRKIKELGGILLEKGLFEENEEKFFSLLKSVKKPRKSNGPIN